MFNPGDIVKDKWDGTLAKVARLRSDNKELMYIYPKEKFIKGGFSHTAITALVQNYELAKQEKPQLAHRG